MFHCRWIWHTLWVSEEATRIAQAKTDVLERNLDGKRDALAGNVALLVDEFKLQESCPRPVDRTRSVAEDYLESMIRKLEAQQQAAVDEMEKVRGEIAMEKSQHPPQLPVPPLAYGCAAGDATTRSG